MSTRRPLSRETDRSLLALPALRDCALCGAVYAPEDAAVLRNERAERLIHLTCHRCAGCMLAATLTSPLGMQVIGFVTDLTAEDAAAIASRTPLGSDDVLAFHTLLQKQTFLESLLIAH